MNFFYQSGTMGFDGAGYKWHKLLGRSFPKFPVITKTITVKPKKGHPYFIIPFGKSVWNKVALHNPGLAYWIKHYYNKNLILSIHVEEFSRAFDIFKAVRRHPVEGVELNISCPNVTSIGDKIYGTVGSYISLFNILKKEGQINSIYLKVNHTQELNRFDRLKLVDGIHINSIPSMGGGVSGRAAQEKNWAFIDRWQNKPYIPPIAGCSWTSFEDIKRLEDMGCKSIGIGSIMLTNPKMVERIQDYGITI